MKNEIEELQKRLQRSINRKKEHIAATRQQMMEQYEKDFGVKPTCVNVW